MSKYHLDCESTYNVPLTSIATSDFFYWISLYDEFIIFLNQMPGSGGWLQLDFWIETVKPPLLLPFIAFEKALHCHLIVSWQ